MGFGHKLTNWPITNNTCIQNRHLFPVLVTVCYELVTTISIFVSKLSNHNCCYLHVLVGKPVIWRQNQNHTW